MKLFHAHRPNVRGFTLVELMITVAIIGILASVASVAYTKYTISAKITQLKQYAMEVSQAQEQYKSQNPGYFTPTNDYSEGDTEWERLLGFSKNGLAAQEITVETISGDSNSTACSICNNFSPNFSGIWYAVRVTQDMDPDSSAKTTIIYHNELPSPVLLNEGE